MNLDNRVAIISGGAQGIGLAIAQDFVARGAAVVIVDAGVSIAGEPAQPDLAVQAAGSSAPPPCAGYRDLAVAQSAVALARERFGAVDIVVNKRRSSATASSSSPTRQAWDAVLHQSHRRAAPACRGDPGNARSSQEWRSPGAIVNIVSTAGIYGNFGQSAYGAAKAGLIGLTRGGTRSCPLRHPLQCRRRSRRRASPEHQADERSAGRL
jgi:NAD(P)-dependent dehydrogenase (short-subunit alcohol dehydrogenase family)